MSTFLIADDSDGKALMLEAMVAKWGKAEQVLRANTTNKAKQLIDAHDITWAFIDYHMPQEDGPVVISYIKEHQPNCKVALVTSGSAQSYRDAATESGADGYICTSLAVDEVERDLNDILLKWE